MVRQGTTITGSRGGNNNEAITEMRATMEELLYSSQTLQGNILTLQERSHDDNPSEENYAIDSQSLSDKIWGASFPENFKSPSLVKFDEKSDPRNT